MAERNELQLKMRSLQEEVSELRVMADRGGNYQQITTEMEERVEALEKELLLTAQKVGNLEKQLKNAQEGLSKEQDRNEKLRSKLRHLSSAERATPSPEAIDTAKAELLAEIESKQKQLAEAQASNTHLSLQLHNEQAERIKLLEELSKLEDRFLGVQKQHASSSFQLKHQLSVANSDLEECKRYVHQLELERQELCTKLHVKPDPNLGFEDSRGGGTFHDAASMSDVSCRNGLSAIDTLYLKNVLFKFIEAMAKNKISERDMLLPAVSTLLGASSEEFAKLKKTLTDEMPGSAKSSFSFWSS